MKMTRLLLLCLIVAFVAVQATVEVSPSPKAPQSPTATKAPAGDGVFKVTPTDGKFEKEYQGWKEVTFNQRPAADGGYPLPSAFQVQAETVIGQKASLSDKLWFADQPKKVYFDLCVPSFELDGASKSLAASDATDKSNKFVTFSGFIVRASDKDLPSWAKTPVLNKPELDEIFRNGVGSYPLTLSSMALNKVVGLKFHAYSSGLFGHDSVDKWTAAINNLVFPAGQPTVCPTVPSDLGGALTKLVDGSANTVNPSTDKEMAKKIVWAIAATLNNQLEYTYRTESKPGVCKTDGCFYGTVYKFHLIALDAILNKNFPGYFTFVYAFISSKMSARYQVLNDQENGLYSLGAFLRPLFARNEFTPNKLKTELGTSTAWKKFYKSAFGTEPAATLTLAGAADEAKTSFPTNYENNFGAYLLESATFRTGSTQETTWSSSLLHHQESFKARIRSLRNRHQSETESADESESEQEQEQTQDSAEDSDSDDFVDVE